MCQPVDVGGHCRGTPLCALVRGTRLSGPVAHPVDPYIRPTRNSGTRPWPERVCIRARAHRCVPLQLPGGVRRTSLSSTTGYIGRRTNCGSIRTWAERIPVIRPMSHLRLSRIIYTEDGRVDAAVRRVEKEEIRYDTRRQIVGRKGEVRR